MFEGKEYVYEVYKTGSFSKAAEKLYLTQPAADLLTILVCLCSIRSMKRIASANMNRLPEGG